MGLPSLARHMSTARISIARLSQPAYSAAIFCRLIPVVFVPLLVITSCADNETGDSILLGTWTATHMKGAPIETTGSMAIISFNEDHTFGSYEVVSGRSFSMSGTWQLRKDSAGVILVMTSSHGTTSFLLDREGDRLMLNRVV